VSGPASFEGLRRLFHAARKRALSATHFEKRTRGRLTRLLLHCQSIRIV
jgi:hypothetical protein